MALFEAVDLATVLFMMAIFFWLSEERKVIMATKLKNALYQEKDKLMQSLDSCLHMSSSFASINHDMFLTGANIEGLPILSRAISG